MPSTRIKNQEKLVLHLMKNGGKTSQDERQPIGKEMLRKLAMNDAFTDEVLIEIVKYLDRARYSNCTGILEIYYSKTYCSGCNLCSSTKVKI